MASRKFLSASTPSRPVCHYPDPTILPLTRAERRAVGSSFPLTNSQARHQRGSNMTLPLIDPHTSVATIRSLLLQVRDQATSGFATQARSPDSALRPALLTTRRRSARTCSSRRTSRTYTSASCRMRNRVPDTSSWSVGDLIRRHRHP